jgi:hypothetical protein
MVHWMKLLLCPICWSYHHMICKILVSTSVKFSTIIRNHHSFLGLYSSYFQGIKNVHFDMTTWTRIIMKKLGRNFVKNWNILSLNLKCEWLNLIDYEWTKYILNIKERCPIYLNMNMFCLALQGISLCLKCLTKQEKSPIHMLSWETSNFILK